MGYRNGSEEGEWWGSNVLRGQWAWGRVEAQDTWQVEALMESTSAASPAPVGALPSQEMETMMCSHFKSLFHKLIGARALLLSCC